MSVRTENVSSGHHREEIGADSHVKSQTTTVKMEKCFADNFVAVKMEPYDGDAECTGSFLSNCVDKFEMKTEQNDLECFHSKHLGSYGEDQRHGSIDKNVEYPQSSAQFGARLHPDAETVYGKPVSTASNVQSQTEVKTEERVTENCTAIKVEQSHSEFVANSTGDFEMKTEEIDLGCDSNEHSTEFPETDDEKLNYKPDSLKDHMLKHTRKKPLECPVCEKIFAFKCNLSTHMLKHSGVKPYKCNVCEKTFTQKSHLNDHMLSHTGEKPHICQVCKKKFSFKCNLSMHMLTHSGEKPHKCSACDKQFRHLSSLNKHMLTHTGEKPHKCALCKMQFSQLSSLNNHTLTHTGEKPHKCTICDKQFRHVSSLSKHMLAHQGVRPHKCTVCEKQFRQLSCLNNHMLRHTGEKPYKCTVCEKPFRHSSSLNVHKLIHTGERPHKCNYCHKQFNQKGHLRKHMIIHTRKQNMDRSNIS